VTTAYDRLGPAYDAWCRSVLEDIPFYVDLAVRSGGPVLELGVGSGRVAVPTALAGVAVVGVDSSPAMLELARRRAEPHDVDLRLVEADMLTLPDLGRFALVTIPFRALLHLSSDAERRAVLAAARERLSPGGVLAFDVFHPDADDIAETHGRWLEREPGIWERATWDASARQLELAVRTGDSEATMDLWWLDPADWRRLLGEAGFCGVEAYGWFDRSPLLPGAVDSVWVAQHRLDGPRCG
jgi:SAM-dependent methyltransferase